MILNLDQKKAKFEFAQRCKTIERKLEWIETELKMSSPDIDVVMNILEGIISRLGEQENYLCGDKFNIKTVQDFLDNVQTMIDGKRKTTIKSWLKIVRPINITQLLLLINETEAAARALEDQDVVMFLGPSQSGKSSTIHFLAGSKFTCRENAMHIEESSKFVDVDNVKTGYNMKSTTRFINPVKISAEALKSLGVVEESYTSNGIILCDAPGFGDTQGAEMDISNGIGITRALQKCHSVKFLFVCSDQIGDTGSLLKGIIQTVGSMFCSIDDHLDAFSYIFTKWNNPSLIYEKIAAIRDALAEKEPPESPLCLISEHMVQSIEKKLYLVKLCGGDPAEILNMVLSKTSQIVNTQETFKDFVSTDSLLKLTEFCLLVQTAIPTALDHGEFDVMATKMQQLCEINTKVRTAEGNRAQQHCTQAICDHLDMVQNYFDDICDRICDPSAVSVLTDENKSLIRFCEGAIDLASIVQYVERETLVPKFATRLEKLTMEFSESFRNTFSELNGAEVLNATLESKHISVSDQSTAAAWREKAHCVKEALLSSEKLSGSEMKESIAYICEQCDLMESSLELRLRFYTSFMISENVNSDSMPKLFTLLDYMAELKSLLSNFPRVNPEHKLCLDVTTAALVQRFRSMEEDANGVFNRGAQELYLMDTDYLQKMVERLGVLSALANNAKINTLSTEHVVIIEESVAASSKALQVMSTTLIAFLTSLVPNSDSIQIIASAQVNKMSTLLALCDLPAQRNFTVAFNRYLASCGQYICDNLKTLESNESSPIDVENIKVAFSNLSTAFKESEAKQYLLHSLEVFRDIVHRSKEYICKVSFDSISGYVFMRLHKINEIEKIPLFGYESSEPDIEDLKSNIAAEIKEIRCLYDTGVNSLEKAVLHVLNSKKLLDFDFKTISDALLIVPHLPHGGSASHYVHAFSTFIQQKLPSYWADIKRLIAEQEGDVAVAKSQLYSASTEWNRSINKLAALREQFSTLTSSTSLPPGRSDAAELFEELPSKIVSKSIAEVLSFLANRQRTLLTYPLAAIEGRRWVDLVNSSVTMWLDPILSDGFLLSTFSVSNEDGLSFRMLSDNTTEMLRTLVKGLKSEISFAASAKKWSEVFHLVKTRIGDLSAADLEEVTSDLTKIVQADIDALLRSTQVYSSSIFPQIFEESVQRVKDFKSIYSGLSSLGIVDASNLAACEKSIQGLVQSRINDSFASLLEKNSFRLLEEYVLSLEDVKSKLDSLSMPCHSPDRERFGNYASYLSHVIKLKNEQIDNAIQEAFNFICEQDILQYYQNPPADVIDSMKDCEDLRNNKYQSCHQEMKERVLNQYACLLFIDPSKLVSNIPAGISVEQYEEQYRQAIDSRAYLPRDFLSGVNDLCSLAEKTIAQQKSSMEIERMSYELQDLSEYIGIFRRHCSESNFNHAKVIKANIETVLISQIKVITDRLGDKDFVHAIEHFAVFSTHLMLFDRTLGELKDTLKSTTTTRIYQIYEQRYEVSRNRVQKFIGTGKITVSDYYVVANGMRYRLPDLTPEEKRTMKYHHTFVYDADRTGQLQLLYKSDVTRKGMELVERMKELFIANVSSLATGKRFDLPLEIVAKFLRSASSRSITGGQSAYIKKAVDSQEKNIKSGLEKLNKVIEGISRKAENIWGNGSVAEVKQLLDTCKDNETGLVLWDDFVASSDCAPYLVATILDTKPLRYKVLRQRILTSFRAILDEAMKVHYLLHPECATPNETDRTRFYEKVNISYQSIQNIDLLVDHLGISIQELHEMKKSMRDHITIEIQKIVDHLRQLKDQLSLSMENMSNSSIGFDNFRAIEESFTDVTVKTEAKQARALVLQMYFSKFKSVQADILKIAALPAENMTPEHVKEVIDCLVQLKTMSNRMSCFRLEINKLIDDSLAQLQKGLSGASRFGLIALHVQNRIQGDSGAAGGEHIKTLLQHNAFDQIVTILRNKKTSTFTIFNVLGLQLDGDKLVECKDVDTGIYRIQSADILLHKRMGLYEQYKLFDQLYWETVEKGITKKTEIMSECVSAAKKTLLGKKGEPLGDKIRNLMCFIFAYWTLSRYNGDSMQMTSTAEKQNPRDAIVQPHAAQVVAIFRLFGVPDAELASKGGLPVFEKHFIQIGTGEGKSVILAVTSVLLALLGYNVDCACYSSYLSERDFKDFETVFKAFDVLQFIKYGTFGSLCEDVINLNGNLREVVESIISGQKSKRDRPLASTRPRVLLIDEVDTFFSPDYYGKLYVPMACIDHPAIRSMAEWLWKSKNERLYWKTVSSSKQFRDCLAAFPRWTDLITEVVKGMLCDLKTVTSSSYKSDHICLNDKIAYKDQDAYNEKIIRGYETMFMYMKEYESKNLSRESMLKSLVGRLNCGGFSYAEIPNMYDGLMGVTGTLQQIVEGPDGALLRDYKISKFTYMPSVYGTNKLVFARDSPQDVAIVSNAEYFIRINEEIWARIKSMQAGVEYNRAVFVFFKDIATLQAFYDDPVFAKLKGHAVMLTEKVSAIGKEGIIRAAASSGQVVLMTKAFGRGTDFICNDKRMIDVGGVHVIQTFLSEQTAEEVQIMGRTARQGNKGSFGMVVRYSDLDTFGITLKNIESIKSTGVLYAALNQKRNEYYSGTLFPIVRDSVKAIAEDFKESTAFLKDALAGRIPQVNSFLMKYNHIELGGSAAAIPSRLVVLMDATGSMGPFIHLAKGAVKQLFQNMNKIVKEKNNSTEISVKYMVYRNYNAPPDKLLEESPWEVLSDNPSRLFNFMDSVTPQYGIDEEAVEVGFARVVEEDAEVDLFFKKQTQPYIT